MRRGITDGTVSVGIGPIDLDVKRARARGWTDAELDDLWGSIEATYRKFLPDIERRHPELVAIAGDGSIICTYPDETLKDDWTRYERRDITVLVGSAGGEKHSISDAYVVGHFAAHPSWGARGLGADRGNETGWSITHVPSGTAVEYNLDEYEARRSICHLDRIVGCHPEVARTFVSETGWAPHSGEWKAIFESIVSQVVTFEDLDGPDWPDKQGGICVGVWPKRGAR